MKKSKGLKVISKCPKLGRASQFDIIKERAKTTTGGTSCKCSSRLAHY